MDGTAQLDSIQRQITDLSKSLGELSGDTKAILRQLDREREDSMEDRARVYRRVEKVEEDVKISAEIAVQARDKTAILNTKTDDLNKLVTEEIKPQTDKLKNVTLKAGAFLSGVILMGTIVVQPIFELVTKTIHKIFN